jgi:hypothetical protein
MNLLGGSLFHQVKLLLDLSNFVVRGRVLTFRIMLKANNMREKKRIEFESQMINILSYELEYFRGSWDMILFLGQGLTFCCPRILLLVLAQSIT